MHAVVGAFNARDWDRGLALIAPDAVDDSAVPARGTVRGRDSFRQRWEIMQAAFPDLQIIVEQSVEAGDMVADRLTMRGTHLGTFMGVPATGRRFEILGLDMMRIRDGRIVQHWALADQAGILAQLGLTGVPAR